MHRMPYPRIQSTPTTQAGSSHVVYQYMWLSGFKSCFAWLLSGPYPLLSSTCIAHLLGAAGGGGLGVEEEHYGVLALEAAQGDAAAVVGPA